MDINFFTKEDEYIEAGIKLIADICSKSTKTTSIALSGGSTPQTLYNALSKSPKIPFEKIDFWQVDERYIPKTDPESNYNFIERTLLTGKQKPHSFHYFDTSLSLEESLKKYKQEIENNLLDPFDLIILGIGTDGHTASLFPHSHALRESEKLVTHTQTDNFKVKDRLTLTFPPILESKNLLLLIKGEDKMETLYRLTQKDINTDDFPAKRLIIHPNLKIFFLH